MSLPDLARDLRHEIGVCLVALKAAKHHPDDMTLARQQNYRERLSQASVLLGRIRKLRPDLFNERVRQTCLKFI